MSSGPFDSEDPTDQRNWAPIPPPEDRPGTPQDDPKTSDHQLDDEHDEPE